MTRGYEYRHGERKFGEGSGNIYIHAGPSSKADHVIVDLKCTHLNKESVFDLKICPWLDRTVGSACLFSPSVGPQL